MGVKGESVSELSSFDDIAQSRKEKDDPITVLGVSMIARGPIIGALVESRSIAKKDYLEEGYLVPRRVRSEVVQSEVVQSEVVRGRSVSQGVWSDTIPHRFHKTLWNGT
ncbi:hypothetical protein PTKIN_Ptkin06aG0220500 [Pterospermum kingtungense]